MDPEPQNLHNTQEDQAESHLEVRAKTSLRMKYEAQSLVIQAQIGGLEGALQRLGLSQRALAQLLLVDPSAVTRWMRQPQSVPPSVYRALQWYLALQEKIPGLTPQYFVGRDGRAETHSLEKKFHMTRAEISEQFTHLNKRVAVLQRALIFAGISLTLMALWILSSVMR